MQFLYSIVMEFSHLISIMIKTAHILKVCQSVFESVSLNGSKLTHFPFTRELSLQSLGCMSVLSCKRTFICLCKITRTSVDQTASVIQLMWKYVERQLTTHFSKVRYSYIRGCTFLVSYKQRSCPII